MLARLLACPPALPVPVHGLQLQEQEQALSYLTQQYRKASYIKQVTDNDRRLSDVNTVGLASTRASLAYQVRGLIRFMEEVFRSKPYVAGQLTPGSPPSMYQLCTYFKVRRGNPTWPIRARWS
jgi:hypothetical protein